MGFLDQTPGFKKFSTLIRTAQMDPELSELQANVTIFVVPDEYLKFSVDFLQNMDIGTARRIVNFCIISRKIDSLLLIASPSQSFVTHYPANNLRVMTIDGITTINECTKILKSDIELDNGMIHVVDNLLVPDSMMSYVYGP